MELDTNEIIVLVIAQGQRLFQQHGKSNYINNIIILANNNARNFSIY